MTGSSSTFVNGHLADRERIPTRRRDMDLSELITLCSQPIGFDERVQMVTEYAHVYPELKYFLIVAYFCKDAFKEIQTTGVIDFIPSKVQKGASPESLSSMWKEVMRLYDTFPSGPKIKRGIAQRLLSQLHVDDAILIQKLLSGKFYMKELNDAVVAAAFPKEIPATPKV